MREDELKEQSVEPEENELTACLTNLSDKKWESFSEAEVCDYVKRFYNIYFDGSGTQKYWHSYAAISAFVNMLEANSVDTSAADDAVTILVDNLAHIRSESDAKLDKPLRKLQDHVKLEMGHVAKTRQMLNRISDIETYRRENSELLKSIHETTQSVAEAAKLSIQLDEKTKEQAKETEKILGDVNVAKGELNALRSQLEELGDQVRKHNIEAVTILSIFASVVFVFSGGIALLGNAFSVVGEAENIAIAFFMIALVSLIGVILFDIVYMQLRYVSKFCAKEKGKIRAGVYIFNGIGIVMVVAALTVYIIMLNGVQ